MYHFFLQVTNRYICNYYTVYEVFTPENMSEGCHRLMCLRPDLQLLSESTGSLSLSSSHDQIGNTRLQA